MCTVSVINTCVMPILLYGCENWILTEMSVQKLESFLGWMAKKALKWPLHFSNTAALVVLGLETMKSRILIRKLCFLLHLLSGEENGVAVSTMRALLDDPDEVCIVKECRDLEVVYNLRLSYELLSDPHSVHVQDIKKNVLQADKALLLDRCLAKAPLIAEVVKRGGSWPALWDSVRHAGSRHTTGLQHLSRLLAHHGRGSKPCPRCEEKPAGGDLTEHVLTIHKEDINIRPHLTAETLLNHLVERDNILFTYRFRNLFSFF